MFFRLVVTLYTLLDVLPTIIHQKRWCGGKAHKKIPPFLPNKYLFQFLLWEPNSCNNGSSLLNYLKLCHLTEHGPDSQHGKQEAPASKSLCERAQIIPVSYFP